MTLVLAVKPLAELHTQYGLPRLILNSAGPTDIVPELTDAYALNLLAGEKLRESAIKKADGSPALFILCVGYIDPVTQRVRYAVDYWSPGRYWAIDTSARAVAEIAYEHAVRAELTQPTLTLLAERFAGGLASLYDVTDVQQR